MIPPGVAAGDYFIAADGRRRRVLECPACKAAFIGVTAYGGQGGKTSGARCPAGHWFSYGSLCYHLTKTGRDQEKTVREKSARDAESVSTDLRLSRAWLAAHDRLVAQLAGRGVAGALIVGTFGRLAEITRRAVE